MGGGGIEQVEDFREEGADDDVGQAAVDEVVI